VRARPSGVETSTLRSDSARVLISSTSPHGEPVRRARRLALAQRGGRGEVRRSVSRSPATAASSWPRWARPQPSRPCVAL